MLDVLLGFLALYFVDVVGTTPAQAGVAVAVWYSILKARLYEAMPGQSGTVMTVGNVFGLIGQFIPLGLGLVAEQFGLQTSLWLLLAGPVAL